MKIIDNFVSKKKQDEIEKLLLSDNFPWYFSPNITSSRHKNFNPALLHIFSKPEGVNSVYFDSILPLIKKAKGHTVLYSKTILQFPNSGDGSLDEKHIDMEREHKVLLYYVKDSDGDTVFFNKKDKINKRVTPKKGRAVLFDGSIWHSSYKPKRKLRCIINFDYLEA